ncbi:MFS transporter [Corynebacterium heidelbergense]|uniref:MFS transporter n=1 Tax=Corynebacterium heidelbergense TaxID=2055947 RepID=UPI001EE75795|nr:MFS transporter [Corynebacterium heidelbergense]WCZ37574.1 putative multidrug resistance protein EmrY [Corynebacterium heidelbergense]
MRVETTPGLNSPNLNNPTPSVSGAAGDPNTPSGSPAPNARLLIGVLVVAAFVVILNETTLSVALPELMRYFRVSAESAQWLSTGFMLTMAVVIPMTGYILSRFTLRRVYVAALSLFLAGTVLAAAAPAFPILLLARIIQASGTALVLPMLMTTIMQLVPIERRGQVFGLVSVVIAVAPAVGPAVSGLILQTGSWRWIFLAMLPLVLASFIAGLWLIRNFTEPTRPGLDVPSVLLSAVGFATAIYGLAGLSQLANGFPMGRVCLLVVGVLILGVFFRRQRSLARAEEAGRGPGPLLNLEPLGDRNFVFSTVVLLLSFGLLFAFIILIPIYAQQVVGLSKLATGLISLPGGIVMALLGPVVGRIYDARGTRILTIPGAALLSLSLVGMAAMGSTAALWYLMVCAIALNAGVALVLTPMMSNALASVPDRIAAHGQAIVNSFQQVAGGVGTAVFVAIMTLGAASAGAVSQQDAIARGVGLAFAVAAGLSLVALAIVVFIRFDARDESQ